MARKKIREHDAKRLLRAQLKRAGLDVALRSVQISPETDWTRLVQENPWLADGHLVAKPDMLFGKRGKHKLVLLDATIDAVKEFVTPRFTQELEVSGARGTLTHWIVEPFVPHKEEYYLAITSEREADVIHFSTHGGMEVEENWDKGLVKELAVPLGSSLESLHFDKALGVDTAPEAHQAKLRAFIAAIFKVFTEQDFTLLELNPFTVTAAGEVVPLDMRAELDDCASYKHAKDWEGIHFPAPFGRKFHPEESYVHSLDGKTGASLKLTIINPTGRVWLLVAGGGASVIFADTVADIGFGKELGNYGEYSGAPNEEETYHYAKTLLQLATRNPDGRNRVLLIGGGIANFTDVAKTFKGIIHALEEFKEQLKAANTRIFVRRAGPNYQLGLKMMRELGERLGVPIEVYGPEIPMTTIIPKAVAYLK